MRPGSELPKGRARKPGESVFDWAVDTGRISPDEAEQWRANIAGNPEMVMMYDRMANVIAAGSAAPLTSAGVRASRPAATEGKTVVKMPRPTHNPAGSGRVAAGTRNDPMAHYARNPAIADLQARGDYQSALEANPNLPTLFASGDLPPFTASGLDPATLVNVPWYARHALAKEADQAKALEMYEDLTGPDALVAAQAYQGHPGNGDYQSRVTEWAMAGNVHRAAKAQQATHERAIAAAAAVEAATGQEDEWTDEQVYEHLFGVPDRRTADRAAVQASASSVGGPKPW